MLGIFRQFNLRYMRLRKGRTAATVGGIALGVVMIVATAIVNRSTLASFEQLVTTAAGRAELQVVPHSGSGFSEEYLRNIEKTFGIQGAYPVVTGTTRVLHKGKEIDALLVYGVDVKKDRQARDYRFESGRFVKAGTAEVVLSAAWAEDHGIGVGDSVGLLASRGIVPFKVAGLIASRGFGVTNAGKLAVISLPDAQTMFAREGKYDQVDIVLEKETTADSVQSRLERKLGPGLAVERPAGRGKDVEETMSGYRFMLGLTGSISLMVGLFIIHTNMETSVEERRYSISMLRALGLRRRRIMALILAEAVFLGLVGGAVGTAVGFFLARAMATALAEVSSALTRLHLTDLGLTPGIVATGLLAGPAAAVAASFPPAYRMLTVSPKEALVPIETSWGRGSWKTYTLGAVFCLIGAGLMLGLIFPEVTGSGALSAGQFEAVGVVGLGILFIGTAAMLPLALRAVARFSRTRSIPLRLAFDNLSRAPGRSSATIAGMMVALTIFVALAAQSSSYERYTRDWIDTSVGWDMLVSSSYFGTQMDVPLDEEFGERLRKIEGVESACTLRFTKTTFKGTKMSLSAFDMDTFFTFVDWDVVDGDERLMESRLRAGTHVAVSTIAARRFGLKPGDEMTFETPEGRASFTLAAVVKDLGGDTGTIYIDRPTYKRLWGDARVDGYDVVLKDGYKVADVKTTVEEEFGKDRNLTIRTHEDFKEGILDIVEQSFSLTDMLVNIAILVAAVGITNASLISVWQRKRELAALRALGARSGVIKRIMLGEAVIQGVCGAVVGSAIGILMGRTLVAAGHQVTGLLLDYRVPWATIVVAFAVATTLSAAGSVIPSRSATRDSIVADLRYE
ncbi:MAG: FtsX-like permease family protein [Candidatus Aquicultorales bacterium]